MAHLWPCPLPTHRYKRGQCDYCLGCKGCPSQCTTNEAFDHIDGLCCCEESGVHAVKGGVGKRAKEDCNSIELPVRRTTRMRAAVDYSEKSEDQVITEERRTAKDDHAERLDALYSLLGAAAQPMEYIMSYTALTSGNKQRRDQLVGHIRTLVRHMVNIISPNDKRASDMLYHMVTNKEQLETRSDASRLLDNISDVSVRCGDKDMQRALKAILFEQLHTDRQEKRFSAMKVKECLMEAAGRYRVSSEKVCIAPCRESSI